MGSLSTRLRKLTAAGRHAAPLLLAAAAAGAGSGAVLAGGGDDIDAATRIVTLPFSDTTDTRSATTAPDDPYLPCASAGSGARSVWWTYTPATDQVVLIDTFGSSYDTVLAVWTGSRGALRLQTCNDDAMLRQSQVWIEATAGTAYFIEAADYDSQAGRGGTLVLAVSTRERALRFGACTVVGEVSSYVLAIGVADLDKDGRPDVVSGDDDGDVTAWRNDGTPFDGPWSGTLADTREGSIYALAVADLDRDSWPDVATGDGDEQVTVCRNDATPFAGRWTSNAAGSRGEPISALAGADLDGDSWPDLVSGDADNQFVAWRNDGTPFAGGWAATVAGSTKALIVAITAADLDRDTRPDVVTGDDADEVIAWRNSGSPFQPGWPKNVMGTSANDLEDVGAGDLDSDGWVDVATGNDATMVHAWRNDTTPFAGSWAATLVGTSPDHIQSLAVGDLDDDGLADIVSGDDSGLVVAWENPGTPFAAGWTPRLIHRYGDYVHGLALADLDDDGDLDVVAGGEENTIVACENRHAAVLAPTSTVVASSVNPSKVGQAVTFTATVAPTAGGGAPSGTVQFAADGVPLGPPATLAGGAAGSAPTSALPAGDRVITAAYGGDASFAASESPPLIQSVREYDAPAGFTIGGMLGVGIAAPERAVHIRGGNAVFRMDRDRDTAAFILARTDAAGGVLKSFVVGVNASAPGNGSFVVNDLGTTTAGAGSNRLTIANDGDAVFAGTVAAKGFFPPSSRRLKTDVQPLAAALEQVLRLRGVRYTSRLTGARELGFVAEDVGAVVAEAVSPVSHAVATIGVDYGRIAPLLVEAIKHQQEEIRALRDAARRLQSLLVALQQLPRQGPEE